MTPRWGTLPRPAEPSAAAVRRIVAGQRESPVTADDRLFTRHHRVRIGRNFERAVDDLRRWRQYDLAWTYVAEPRPPIAVGGVSATVARGCSAAGR